MRVFVRSEVPASGHDLCSTVGEKRGEASADGRVHVGAPFSVHHEAECMHSGEERVGAVSDTHFVDLRFHFGRAGEFPCAVVLFTQAVLDVSPK